MPQRHFRPDCHRVASLLLFVLVGGLAIMMLTHDWLRSAPAHDHILFGAPASSLAHHRHPWDEPDPTSTAWTSVEPATPASSPDAGAPGGRVVSLHAGTGLLLELLDFTTVAVLALLLSQFGQRPGIRLAPVDSSCVAGRRPGPPLPPPRYA